MLYQVKLKSGKEIIYSLNDADLLSKDKKKKLDAIRTNIEATLKGKDGNLTDEIVSIEEDKQIEVKSSSLRQVVEWFAVDSLDNTVYGPFKTKKEADNFLKRDNVVVFPRLI